MKRSSVILGLILLLGGGRPSPGAAGQPPAKPSSPPDEAPVVGAPSRCRCFRNRTSSTPAPTPSTSGPPLVPGATRTTTSRTRDRAQPGLCDVDPATEPPDGTFEHKLSGRTYRVYRKDGQLRHEEVLRTAEGKEIARVDLPLRYRVGSGHFTRTYAVEVDGFLHESPVTWYAAKNRWDMSPGCDMPRHWSFERPVQIGCVVCHAGRAEPIGESEHRLTLHEKAVGCESCHGPGERHQEFHRTQKLAPGASDPTIVHPGKLSPLARIRPRGVPPQLARAGTRARARDQRLSSGSAAVGFPDPPHLRQQRGWDDGGGSRGAVAPEQVLPGEHESDVRDVPRPARAGQARRPGRVLPAEVP